MRRALAALAIVAALSTPASGQVIFGEVVKYVAAGAPDSRPWSNANSPSTAASLNTMNSAAGVVAGETVRMLPGVYSGSISPVNSGTVGGRITILGEQADSTLVQVSSISLSRSHTTVRWIRATGSATLGWSLVNANPAARFDSLLSCDVHEVFILGAQNCVVYGNGIGLHTPPNTKGGEVHFMQDGFVALFGNSSPINNTFRRNTIFCQMDGQQGFKLRAARSNTIDSNRVVLRYTTVGQDGVGRILYNAHGNTFRDNYWEADAITAFPAGSWNAFMVRDSCSFNAFVRDTFIVGKNSNNPAVGRFSGSGSNPPFGGPVNHNSYTACIYQTKWGFEYQSGTRQETHQNSTYISAGNDLWFLVNGGSDSRGNLMDHCTLLAGRRCLVWDPSGDPGWTMKSNIFASRGALPIGTGGAVNTFTQNFPNNAFWTMNWNVYWSPTFTSVPGDRSLQWDSFGSARPGVPGTSWYTAGFDQNSRHGSPRFVDSTGTGIDVRLRAGSLAIGAGEGGTDAGAFGAAGADPCLDAALPSTPSGFAVAISGARVVMDLAALPCAHQGAWPAEATIVRVRRSTSPITNNAEFNAATVVFDDAADVLGVACGAPVNDADLEATPAQGTWHYAIVAEQDTAGFPRSCIATATLVAPDVTPPAQPSDLIATAISQNEVQITWTGSGDDGMTGNASSYTIARSGALITQGNFNLANLITVQGPHAPGVTRTFQWPGLTPGGTYYFAVREADEVPNFANVSNSDSATTFAEAQPQPPAPITSLSATAVKVGMASIAWTATGNDGTTGTALEYDFVYRIGGLVLAQVVDTVHTETLTPQGETYRLRYPEADVPLPTASGTGQSFNFVARPGATYGIAVRVRGSVGWSAWSNIATVTIPNGVETSPNFPRDFSYMGAGTPYPKQYPFLHSNNLTVNEPVIEQLCRLEAFTTNPSASISDSFTAVARARDKFNASTLILAEPTPGAAYMHGPDTLRNETTYRWRRDYNDRAWQAMENINTMINGREWPPGITQPYQVGYGSPRGINPAIADTTRPSPWLWETTRKMAMAGTVVNADSGCAGCTIRNVNLALRDSLGRYLVPDSLAPILVDVYFTQARYTTVDGFLRYMFGGFQWDNLSLSITSHAQTWGGIDYARAAQAPFNYTSRAAFEAGYTQGALRLIRKVIELMPAEATIFGCNGENGPGQDYLSGYMQEGVDAQQLNWQNVIMRSPGGFEQMRLQYPRRPAFATMFAFQSTGVQGDTGYVASFDPDTANVRDEFTRAFTAAAITDAHLNFGPLTAAGASTWMTPQGGWWNLSFDERRVDAASGQAYPFSDDHFRYWMGRALGGFYVYQPSLSGALFNDDLSNGPNPDSSGWSLTDNANGRMTVVPRPGGGHCLEINTVRRHPYAYDWMFGASTLAKTWVTTTTPLYRTITLDIQADTARHVSVLLLANSGSPWQASTMANVRVWADTNWRTQGVTIPNPGNVNDSVRIAIFCGDMLGRVRVDNVRMWDGDSIVYRRDFDNASVVFNPGATSRRVVFEAQKKKLTARDGVWQNTNNGHIVTSLVVPPENGFAVIPYDLDVTRPAAPSGLVGANVGCDGVHLQWTVPGDDSLAGVAESYEIRTRTDAPVTDANWNTSTVSESDLAEPAGNFHKSSVGGYVGPLTVHAGIAYTDEAGHRGAIASVSVALPSCAGAPAAGLVELRSVKGRGRPVLARRIR